LCYIAASDDGVASGVCMRAGIWREKISFDLSSRALELLTTLYTTKTMMNYSLCNRLLVVFALLSNISLQIVVCLTYNYGDGSYYVGEVDDFGLPSGTGKFYNTSGNLGKTSTPLYSGCRAA